MKITALAPWFGNKRTLAPKIVEALGPHSAYWEPFCGSMAVLMTKEPASAETVNDLHRDLINLTRVLQHDNLGPMLYRCLRRILTSQEELESAKARLFGNPAPTEGGLTFDRAVDYFVNSWMGISGIAGSKGGESGKRGIARRFTSNGGSPSVRYTNAVQSIPAWRRRLRNVTVLRTCGIEICEKVEDKPGTVIYVDPPYIEKSDEYIHDFTPADHERLAEALQRYRKTRVVVSYYEHEWLNTLYPAARWQRIDCTMRKSMKNPNVKTTRRTAPEVLLVNGVVGRELFG